MSNMATMRRTGTNKQHSGPLVPATAFFSSNNYAPSSNDIAANSARRRRSLALGENALTRSSLQSDDLRAHLGIQTAPFLSQDYGFEQYENAYEKTRGAFVGYQEAQAPSSVFGSQEANYARAAARRRRLSMGSQMELIQSQLETQPRPRQKSFVSTAAIPSRESLVIRTAPSSRSNSAPKSRPFDENGNLYSSESSRPLHSDRVSESMPNFKPSEVKPEFRMSSSENGYTHGYVYSPTESGNCLPVVRQTSKSESHTPILQSPKGKQSTPTKYLSARAVAERLAKAIRGGTKSSKNKVDTKLAMPSSDHQEASGILSDDSSGSKGVAQSPERRFILEQALDQSGGIYADFNEKSQISAFRDRKVDTGAHEEKEIDMLKSWLDGMKQQGEGVYDDLEKKAKVTCERLELLDEEQAMLDDRVLSLHDFQSSHGMRSGDSIAAVQQRLRKMHEEKKLLALEAASELRRRISERSAARKVFTLMKREMDAYAKVMEKEKAELQSKLEEEIARRESSWVVKLDRIRAEERELRERVMNLQEENSYIQREISTLSSKDGNTKGKIKELESHVDSYRTRAEQAEAELDALQQAYVEKESETRNLRKIVERLPVLSGDYEMRINTLQQSYKDGRVESEMSVENRKPSKLQRELLRLSSLEIALQSEMHALQGGAAATGYGDHLEDEQSTTGHRQKSMEELRGELDRLQSQAVELQDENNLLSVKLRLAVRERDDMRKALQEAEEEVRELREEAGVCQSSREESHVARESSTMLQADSAHELEADVDSQGSRQLTTFHARAESTAVSDHQVQARESQLSRLKHEFGKQEDIIRGLEHSLSIAGKTVEAQKVRITRLSARNEELVRLYHSKESEVQDLRILSSAEAEGRRVCEQELSQLREQAVKCKQELRSQDLNCKLLREKLSSKEAELEQRNDEVVALEHRRDWLEAEVQKLQRLLGEANQRATTLELQCEDQKEKIKNLQADVEGHVKELMKVKDHLPRVLKERDELSHEAEQMGREALRLSAEVEVLRRKVHELDEDVMVRDGQISILCNTLEDRE